MTHKTFNYHKQADVVLYAKDSGFRLTIERNRGQYVVISWYASLTGWFKGATVNCTDTAQVEQTCNYILQTKGDDNDN